MRMRILAAACAGVLAAGMLAAAGPVAVAGGPVAVAVLCQGPGRPVSRGPGGARQPRLPAAADQRQRHVVPLEGYPRLTLLEATGRALPTRTRPGPTYFDRDPGPRLIVLSPGETASADISFGAAGSRADVTALARHTPYYP